MPSELTQADMTALTELRNFLASSFKGATVGTFEIDNGVAALDKAIRTLNEKQK